MSSYPGFLSLHVLPGLEFSRRDGCLETGLTGKMAQQRAHAQGLHGGQLRGEIDSRQRPHLVEGAHRHHLVKTAVTTRVQNLAGWQHAIGKIRM